MVEKISVLIALEGGKEVERQLEGIGDAGQKMFNNLAKSASKVGGFQNLNIEEVEARLTKAKVAGEDFAKIMNAITTAIKWEKMVAGMEVVERSFDRLGGVGARAFGALAIAAQKFGATITRALGPLASAARALGPVGIAAASVTAGSVALVKFAGAAEDTFKALTELQKASGDSIENISALAHVFERGGTPAKDFAKAFGDLAVQVAESSRTMADDIEQSSRRVEQALLAEEQATLGVKDAKLNLKRAQLQERELRTGIRDPFAEKRIAKEEAALRVKQAQLAVNAAVMAQEQAEHNRLVAQANDLGKLIELYQQMGRGASAAFDPLTTQATKTQALLAALAKAGNNWKSVLANILRNASELERIQIGKVLGLSPEMIQTLAEGNAKLQQMMRLAQQLGIAFTTLDQANLDRLIQSQNTAGALFDAIKEKMGALVAPAIASFWEGFTQRLQELIPVFTQIASSIGQMDFSRLGAAAADFLATLAKIAAGWAAMLSGQVSLTDVLSQMLQQAGQIAVQIGVAIGQGIVQGIIQAIGSGIGSIWEAIKSGMSFGGGAPSMPGGGGGFAGGGLLGGRGTGTSDSNLAWVSRGEHIMPARAVAQPGVLAFLEALRRSGGNLRNVLNGMGRFALGGLVPRPAYAFAAGGPVGSMSHVTINFPGTPPISGLRASASVVDQLQKAAALAQVRSGGRKPSRYS